MLYMCGSNLESDNGAATADITEILRSRYNAEAVNIIAMLGGTRKWWGGMDAQQTAVYEIGGNRPKQVWSDGLMNMGDPSTLSSLLDYAKEVSLPLSEEQKDGLTEVTATLVVEYDSAAFPQDYNVPEEGKIVSLLERTEMDLSSGETASGTLQGLFLCTKTEEGEDLPILMKTSPAETGFSFAPVNDISLSLADHLSSLLMYPVLELSGSADTQEGTAALEEIHIKAPFAEEGEQNACSNWPLSCFKSCSVFSPGMEIVEDGSGNWAYGSGVGDTFYDSVLDDAIRLELKPAEALLETEGAKSLGVIYQLSYEDGSYILTDIYPWS